VNDQRGAPLAARGPDPILQRCRTARYHAPRDGRQSAQISVHVRRFVADESALGFGRATRSESGLPWRWVA
jgi:hypothetical protein